MLNEYDFDEGVMGEMVAGINVPSIQPSAYSSRRTDTNMMVDLERVMGEERAREDKRIRALK